MPENPTSTTATPPIVLTIAGSDSSGGAGIQADLKTFMACKVYGASVITALTAQNTKGVTAIHTPPGSFVRAQIDAVVQDLNVAATKIGMIANKDIAKVVASALNDCSLGTIVVDPVMVATSGDILLQPDAQKVLKEEIIPQADLITPNAHEAAALTTTNFAQNQSELEAQGQKLLALGCKAVLMKGGHVDTDSAIDVLVTQNGTTVFAAPRVTTTNTHGTGCTLAAAITANLALGLSLNKAIKVAKDYLTAALVSAAHHQIGTGPGPVDHRVIQGKKS